MSITEQLEYRAPELPGWAQGAPAARPSFEFWMRFSDGRDADPLALAALVDGAAPAVLDIGAPGSATIELTVHVRARPAPGWLACRTTTRHVIGGYHEEDFEIWDSGREPRRPVAPIRAASGIALSRFPQHAGWRVDRASPEDFHPQPVNQPRQIYTSAADRHSGRRWTPAPPARIWIPAAVLALAVVVGETLRSLA